MYLHILNTKRTCTQTNLVLKEGVAACMQSRKLGMALGKQPPTPRYM